MKKITEASSDIDIVFLPPDSFLGSQAELIARYLTQAKIPSVGPSMNMVKGGIFMATRFDYYASGKSAARIIDRHRKGESLGSIPVQKNPSVLLINETTSKRLRINIPDTVLEHVKFIQ